MRGKKIYVIIGVILAILSSAVWYVSSQKTNNVAQVSQQVETSATTTPLNTSEWLTYESKEYGFRFKYPRELEVWDGKDEVPPYRGVYLVLPGKYPNIKDPTRYWSDELNDFLIAIVNNPYLGYSGTTTDDFWQFIGEDKKVPETFLSKSGEQYILHRGGMYGRSSEVTSVFIPKNDTYYELSLVGLEPESVQILVGEISDPQVLESMQKYPEFLKILEGIYSTFEIIQ
jgi:hypothetical protein